MVKKEAEGAAIPPVQTRDPVFCVDCMLPIQSAGVGQIFAHLDLRLRRWVCPKCWAIRKEAEATGREGLPHWWGARKGGK